ncbi:MAG: hypothetical protein NC429_11350 [Lachnospiraceae bacterium]|nr:hypothetical protein [Lachnospiraceae bacterium]
MDKKKTGILLLIALVGVATGIIIFILFFKTGDDYVKNADEGGITRCEWMEMLCEQTGIIEYRNETPYFSDIEKDSTYYPYLQSAVEWEVLDPEDDFNGENFASGEFVAITAMKTIGERKLQIYLGTEDGLTDEDYTELAIGHGLIEEQQLSEGMSSEECGQVLNTLKSLYFSELRKDDYSNVVYQDGVVELLSGDVLQSNDDYTEIVVSDNIRDSLKEGTIIVFEQQNTQLKAAKEITEIASDGTLSLKPVELEQAVESFTVSDITELTFADIVNYYGLEENDDAINALNYRQGDEQLIDTKVFPFEKDSKGFKISLSTTEEEEQKYLEIQVTDNDTGLSYTFPKYKTEKGSEYDIEIDIDKLCIGVQADYSSLGVIPNYAEIAVDAHAAFTGTIKEEDAEKKIPLFKTPVPLGSGVVGVDVQIALVISAEGSMSFAAELPVEVDMCFEQGKGFKNYKNDVSIENPAIEINCEASTMFCLEPTLTAFGIGIIDGEVEAGVTANAQTVFRPNRQTCTDVSISFPVITVSACGDDKADTVVGNMGFSGEWEILSAENAPFQKKLHWEFFSGKMPQFVETCTYEESGQDTETDNPDEEENRENISVNTYHTRYREVNQDDSPVFSFDYPDNWEISKEEVNGNSMDLFWEYAKEVVELTNERGVTVTFIKIDGELFELARGASGHFYTEYKAEKITDAVPILSEDSANFVVAKMTLLGEMFPEVDLDIQPASSEHVSYAVMQESVVDEYIDMYDGIFGGMGMYAYYEGISFEYPEPYVFFAEAPEGQFTEEEEEEVIGILTSFREE